MPPVVVPATPLQLENAKKLIEEQKLLMISTTWCPDCTYAKKVFEDLKVTPHVVEVDIIEGGKEVHAAFYELTGKTYVPNIYINGEHIGTDTDIKRLIEEGELNKKLQAAGLLA